MRSLAFRLALLILVPLTVGAAPPDAPSGKFEGADLFSLQYATDPQIRPDGQS